MARSANRNRARGAFDIWFPAYRNWPKEVKTGPLPCERPGPLTRNFDDEFYCIRRPAYYVFIYAGVAQEKWLAARRPKDANHQWQHNDGGICLLWSRDFGSSIVARNWSAFAAHTVIAWLPDGRTVWPDYWSVQKSFDAEAGTLDVTSTMLDLPMRIVRRYRFPDDRIQCEVEITATEPLTLKRLAHCIPYPPEKESKTVVEPIDAAGGRCAGLLITNASGKGHRFIFDQAYPFDIGQNHSVDHYANERTYGRALIDLPTDWQPGKPIIVKYEIIPH